VEEKANLLFKADQGLSKIEAASKSITSMTCNKKTRAMSYSDNY